MSKLLCNIVIYRPDYEMLTANYSPRHVETLLDEAATLIDRCLHDFKEYASLDYAWNHFLTELRVQEKEVDLERHLEGEEAPPAEEAKGEEKEEELSAADMTAAAAAQAGEPTEEGEPEEATSEEAAAAEEAPRVKTPLELRVEALQRKKDLAAPGQPFALHEQRDLVLRRLCRDYEEAMNLACVTEKGLRKYYGHKDISSPLPAEAEPLSASLTSLAMWIRDSREWLGRYHRQEQIFTRVVSLRSLVQRAMWTQVKHARDSFSLKVHVPPELLRSHDNCRILSIGAALVGGEVGAVQWSITVRLPQEAVYERGGETVDVDQADLPPCLLGRVENRKSPHPVEMCGVATHLNASPLGRATQGGVWQVEITRPFGGNSETFGHLEDVVLEIQVAGRPKEGKKAALPG